MKFYNAIKTDPFQIVTKAEIIWMKLFYEVTFKITPQEKITQSKLLDFYLEERNDLQTFFQVFFFEWVQASQGKDFHGIFGLMAKKNCKEFKYHGDRKLFSFIKTKITTDFISFYSFEFCVSIVGLYETFWNNSNYIYIYNSKNYLHSYTKRIKTRYSSLQNNWTKAVKSFMKLSKFTVF